MIVIIGSKKFKAMQNEIKQLKQDVHNLKVEVYMPIAEAEMPDGKIKQRVTLQGVVRTIYKKIMKVKMNPVELAVLKSEIAESEKKPLIHRIH